MRPRIPTGWYCLFIVALTLAVALVCEVVYGRSVPVPTFPSESPPAAPVYGPGLTPGIPSLDLP